MARLYFFVVEEDTISCNSSNDQAKNTCFATLKVTQVTQGIELSQRNYNGNLNFFQIKAMYTQGVYGAALDREKNDSDRRKWLELPFELNDLKYKPFLSKLNILN